MPIITLDGVPIAYTDTGAPAGRPDAATVVFGHGLLFGGWMFRAQLESLQHDYRCVTLDWRGQGETPPTADGYDMDTLAADAVGLIRALDAGPVHWVGLSMGGFVGQRLAARHGELLRSLTLLDTSAHAEDPAKIGEYHRLALALRWFGIRPIAGRVAPHMFGPTFRASGTGRDVVREWSRRLTRIDRIGTRDAVHGVTERGAVDHELPAITVPTQIVVGEDDIATPPPHARHIASRIPHAQLHTIPACGHSSSLEQPEAVTALLRAFLASVESSTAPTEPQPT
ncbi:alpha/beta fold hydrolase [Nocardia alba]|uniref:Pimeloyl-ACP methyl ester carboxylesterase n=1 Tax=Nocardia alba TaxID=225051 RepID=A0A4R1FPB0_9NOCA|nr:alpha/beta fold hydrolase [Nocardia alba]TCJ95304.1 pimeloyl-ACP methyl ester carboxylesterase [Nocardia alba]